MSLRLHEIAEANHRIQNPIDHAKLMLVGEICRLQPGMRQLDLACGKGEMLSQWARAYGITGTGIDISDVFLAAAVARAAELGVADRLTLIQGDAAQYEPQPNAYDVVSCIGASWIGRGMQGTIDLMRRALKPGGLLLLGEPYWTEEPPDEAYDALGVRRDEYCTLAGFLTRCKAAQVELVEMVLANADTWDRYEALHWMTINDFVRAHPDDPITPELRAWGDRNQKTYLEYTRDYFGWGVFVFRTLQQW